MCHMVIEGSLPGIRNLATAPTMRPMKMTEIFPIGPKYLSADRLSDVRIPHDAELSLNYDLIGSRVLTPGLPIL